jgi:aminopeptidase YwaD
LRIYLSDGKIENIAFEEVRMKKMLAAVALILFFANFVSAQPAEGIPKTLLPVSLLREIINEASGDLALQNEIFIAGVNRNRLPEEYASGYFEPKFLMERLKEYGITDARIIDLPTRGPQTWDAEMGELWVLKPYKRKIADLKEIAASLCGGSSTTDTTADLIYVGPGNRKEYYEGKDVKGKIVLVNGMPEMARQLAVEQNGALGLIGYGSSHPEYDPDEVGWSSIRASEKEKKTFGFMISTRLGNDLRDMLERGQKIELRAIAKAQMVPYKEQMVDAFIKGKDYPNEELVFTAHLYEGLAKQGANDDISGCVAILETARTLKKLMDDGKIPALKRSVRFLFVPEISGTAAYLKKYPETAKRFFANINEDMVGEGLIKNLSYLNLEQTPWSLPTYLNDVVRSFVEWVGETQQNEGREAVLPIWSPTGSRDPFYYLVTRFSGGSDHIVFVDGGVRVPAVMFIVWPDMWYHTSGDTTDKSDSTQLKRIAFLGASSAVFLANADVAEIETMIAEVGKRSLGRIGSEISKAEGLIQAAAKEKIHEALKDAENIVGQALVRESDTLASIRFFIKKNTDLESLLKLKLKALEDQKVPLLKGIEDVYKYRCLKENIKPQKPASTSDEVRLGKIVPVRTEKMQGYFDAYEFYMKMREMKESSPMRLGQAEAEVRNFIDGKKSVLDIRNAASAEFDPIPLKNVEDYLKFLEKIGFVTLKQK